MYTRRIAGYGMVSSGYVSGCHAALDVICYFLAGPFQPQSAPLPADDLRHVENHLRVEDGAEVHGVRERSGAVGAACGLHSVYAVAPQLYSGRPMLLMLPLGLARAVSRIAFSCNGSRDSRSSTRRDVDTVGLQNGSFWWSSSTHARGIPALAGAAAQQAIANRSINMTYWRGNNKRQSKSIMHLIVLPPGRFFLCLEYTCLHAELTPAS
ncbi:unnamed protein product [Phytophthora lilii]|uniref:Unnamed protein product n=1 Tax=Phytophthora lilii TaxID=2077276 RepID=A0A9W6UD18_9STRA|nr:unnamed protein product [Phytophthora lilii]